MGAEYWADLIARTLARGITNVVVGIPFGLLILRCAVVSGLCEWASLPRPTMRQSIVIVSAITFLSA